MSKWKSRSATPVDPTVAGRAIWSLICAVAGVTGNLDAARANSLDEWRFTVTAGAGIGPEFPGAKAFEAGPILLGRIDSGDFSLEISPAALKATLVRDQGVSAGPVVRRRGSRDDIEERRVRALGKIDSTTEVGGFVNADLGPVSISAELTKDVGDVHQSWVGELSLQTGIPISSQITLAPRVGVTFAGGPFVTTYFGVTPAGAVASGLKPYRPSGGLMAAGLGTSLSYRFASNWAITAGGSWNRLVGDAAKSPIVRDVGTPNMFSAAVTLSYRF